MADLLEDLDRAFESDVAIDEIGIIMTPPPPNLVLIDHKLGLSYKILKPLFVYAISEFYDTLRALKHDELRLSDPLTSDMVLRLTRATLVVKGDMPMFYNLRKQVLKANATIEAIEKELSFLSLLFTKHPKSPSTWQHRRWCLKERYCLRNTVQVCGQKMEPCTLSGSDLKLQLDTNEIQIELELCSRMSESYPKNYYSWTHRLWLLQFMDIEQLESELLFTRNWLYCHVSDHSGSNHRHQVTLRILSLLSLSYLPSVSSSSSSSSSIQQHLGSDTSGPKMRNYILKLISYLGMQSHVAFDFYSKNNNASRINNGIAGDENNTDNVTSCESTDRLQRFKCQILFIEYLFRESRDLILERPGNFHFLFFIYHLSFYIFHLNFS